MNYTTAILLFNQNVRAVRAIYEPDDHGSRQKDYVFKTLDATIQKDDLVVVPTDTRHKFTVVKVTEVDVDVDPEDPTIHKWVAGKVPLADYEATLADEDKFVETLKTAQKKSKRDEIKTKIMDAYKAGDLDKLPIANAPAIGYYSKEEAGGQ